MPFRNNGWSSATRMCWVSNLLAPSVAVDGQAHWYRPLGQARQCNYGAGLQGAGAPSGSSEAFLFQGVPAINSRKGWGRLAPVQHL
jgi:hypothetical protein